MRIVFVGAVAFSRHCLEQTILAGGNVVAVVTLPPERSHRHSDFADVGSDAESRGIPVLRVNQIRDPESLSAIAEYRPDVVFVFGWSQLLPPELLTMPPMGCIGTHPALLPRNRGRHPLVWALVEGLTESGLTFLYLDEGTDTGDILWQRAFPIALEDDAASLYKKIEDLASAGIAEFVPQLKNHTATRRGQDHSLGTYWRKRTEADGEVLWAGPSLKIYNLIRGLTRPYVGAHTYCRGQKMIIWRAEPPATDRIIGCNSAEPGTILSAQDGQLIVATANGELTITEFAWCDGKVEMLDGASLGGKV